MDDMGPPGTAFVAGEILFAPTGFGHFRRGYSTIGALQMVLLAVIVYVHALAPVDLEAVRGRVILTALFFAWITADAMRLFAGVLSSTTALPLSRVLALVGIILYPAVLAAWLLY
jgi:hypothetical protein